MVELLGRRLPRRGPRVCSRRQSIFLSRGQQIVNSLVKGMFGTQDVRNYTALMRDAPLKCDQLR
jgi:hypothetical protein